MIGPRSGTRRTVARPVRRAEGAEPEIDPAGRETGLNVVEFACQGHVPSRQRRWLQAMAVRMPASASRRPAGKQGITHAGDGPDRAPAFRLHRRTSGPECRRAQVGCSGEFDGAIPAAARGAAGPQAADISGAAGAAWRRSAAAWPHTGEAKHLFLNQARIG